MHLSLCLPVPKCLCRNNASLSQSGVELSSFVCVKPANVLPQHVVQKAITDAVRLSLRCGHPQTDLDVATHHHHTANDWKQNPKKAWYNPFFSFFFFFFFFESRRKFYYRVSSFSGTLLPVKITNETISPLYLSHSCFVQTIGSWCTALDWSTLLILNRQKFNQSINSMYGSNLKWYPIKQLNLYVIYSLQMIYIYIYTLLLEK